MNDIDVFEASTLVKKSTIRVPGRIVNLYGNSTTMQTCFSIGNGGWNWKDGSIENLNITSLNRCHMHSSQNYYITLSENLYKVFSSQRNFEFYDNELIGAIGEYLILSKSIVSILRIQFR